MVSESVSYLGVSVGVIPKNDNVCGVQAGFWSDARRVKGFQFGGLFAGADGNVKGVQAGLGAASVDVRGVQVGLGVVAETVKGVQAGLVSIAYDDIKGVQAGLGVVAEGGNVYGSQVGLISGADDVKGFQFGSLGAIAEGDVYGVQAGLVSIARGEDSVGRQFGLLLWGPGNAWWNPSVGYQRLEPGKKVKPLGTLEKLVKKLFGK